MVKFHKALAVAWFLWDQALILHERLLGPNLSFKPVQIVFLSVLWLLKAVMLAGLFAGRRWAMFSLIVISGLSALSLPLAVIPAAAKTAPVLANGMVNLAIFIYLMREARKPSVVRF